MAGEVIGLDKFVGTAAGGFDKMKGRRGPQRWKVSSCLGAVAGGGMSRVDDEVDVDVAAAGGLDGRWRATYAALHWRYWRRGHPSISLLKGGVASPKVRQWPYLRVRNTDKSTVGALCG